MSLCGEKKIVIRTYFKIPKQINTTTLQRHNALDYIITLLSDLAASWQNQILRWLVVSS
jgi:hypothetical protein